MLVLSVCVRQCVSVLEGVCVCVCVCELERGGRLP